MLWGISGRRTRTPCEPEAPTAPPTAPVASRKPSRTCVVPPLVVLSWFINFIISCLSFNVGKCWIKQLVMMFYHSTVDIWCYPTLKHLAIKIRKPLTNSWAVRKIGTRCCAAGTSSWCHRSTPKAGLRRFPWGALGDGQFAPVWMSQIGYSMVPKSNGFHHQFTFQGVSVTHLWTNMDKPNFGFLVMGPRMLLPDRCVFSRVPHPCHSNNLLCEGLHG
jgi:hypothetical protein